jgi:hypothetical protein
MADDYGRYPLLKGGKSVVELGDHTLVDHSGRFIFFI